MWRDGITKRKETRKEIDMPVKPAYIKTLGKELMERYPEVFTSDYEENKEKVEELTNIESKNVRNRIAGYITHHVSSEAKATS